MGRLGGRKAMGRLGGRKAMGRLGGRKAMGRLGGRKAMGRLGGRKAMGRLGGRKAMGGLGHYLPGSGPFLRWLLLELNCSNLPSSAFLASSFVYSKAIKTWMV